MGPCGNDLLPFGGYEGVDLAVPKRVGLASKADTAVKLIGRKKIDLCLTRQRKAPLCHDLAFPAQSVTAAGLLTVQNIREQGICPSGDGPAVYRYGNFV